MTVRIGDAQLDVDVPVSKKQALVLREGTKVASAIRSAIKSLTEQDESGG